LKFIHFGTSFLEIVFSKLLFTNNTTYTYPVRGLLS